MFNNYFSQQCPTVDNDSSTPPNIAFATEQKPSTFEFCTNDINKIITPLDPNKAHGHDEISIQMIKLCAQFSLETALKINVSLKNGR